MSMTDSSRHNVHPHPTKYSPYPLHKRQSSKYRAPPIMITTSSQTSIPTNNNGYYYNQYTNNHNRPGPNPNPNNNTIRIVSDKECAVCFFYPILVQICCAHNRKKHKTNVYHHTKRR